MFKYDSSGIIVSGTGGAVIIGTNVGLVNWWSKMCVELINDYLQIKMDVIKNIKALKTVLTNFDISFYHKQFLLTLINNFLNYTIYKG